MSTQNGISYQDPRNINLRGGTRGAGVIRWDRYSHAGFHATSPFGSDEVGLYVNSSGNLIYSYLGTATTLGAAGTPGAIPSLDAIFAGDQTLDLGSASTLTIDRSSGNNDVLTITNTGAGSGDLIQITNVGTGKDINGTSGTWSFSKLGAGVALTMTLAGTADADSLTLTQGDVSIADGKVAITNADNEGTLVVTNNGLTSAAAASFQGSGTFTGSTTSSFLLVSPSGLTTGTAIYVVAGALTTGKLAHFVGNAVTTGILVHIASSVATTVLTGAGRLFKVDHTGSATGTGILSEFNSAAADETVIVKVTASAALALGTAVAISASSMTTGFGLTLADLDSLTSGIGIHVASAATAITGAGRLLYVNHTGVTSTSGTLVEFATAAADETILVALTANDLATGKMLSGGTNVALTTGQLISFAHTTSVIADGGSMLRLSSTGINTGGATNGTMLDVQTTSQVAGTQVLFKAGAVTTGVVLSLISTTGLTSGSVIRATTSTAGAIATNGAFSFTGTGDYTVSATGVGLFHIGATATTAGTIFSIKGDALTTGVAAYISDTAGTGMTSGSLLRVATATTGAVATNGVVSIRATGAYTSTSNTGLVDVLASATTAGTVVRIASSAAGQTATELLRVVASGFTTGYTGNVAYFESSSTTGAANVIAVSSANSTAGNAVSITANSLTTGTGLLVTSSGTLTTTGEMISVVANSATTCTGLVRISGTGLTDGFAIEVTGGGANVTASGGVANFTGGASTDGSVLKITTTGVYTGTVGVVDINAASATTGVILDIGAAGLTTGTAIKVTATEATLSSGKYLEFYDGAANDFSVARYGATVIAGNALGTAALTLTKGDITVSDGNLTVAGKIIFNATETIAAGGTSTALALTKTVHHIDADAGGDTFTLADGVAGQIMYITMESSTGTATITPTNFASGTSITFNAAGDSVVLLFIDSKWYIIGGNSYAIV